MDCMLRVILRKYEGWFSRFRPVSELEIAAEAQLSVERVHELMKVLWRMKIIRYIPANNSPLVRFDTERLPVKSLYIAPESYQLRHRLMMERFESIVEYVTSEDRCRSQIIENYFGDKESKECGVCDVCLRKRRSAENQMPVAERIVAMLGDAELDIKELTSAMNIAPERVVEVVDKMVAEKKISISKYGKLKING